MALTLEHPHTDLVKIIAFLKQTFEKNGKTKAVIAVSGGIDSALSLTLLAQALSKEDIFPILLPYGEQSVEDSKKICAFNQIPEQNITVQNIQTSVDEIINTVGVGKSDQLRIGNIMARVRMIFVYDLAKKYDALVVGTENKSEKYLAYFTRFGDEASDVEPIQHLYKTQVRQLAKHLEIPPSILEKAPSAGLWAGQTDEEELGFTYEQADQVMEQHIDLKKPVERIAVQNFDPAVIKKVVARITSQHFKHEVPYTM
jgi:NAD+ synthase